MDLIDKKTLSIADLKAAYDFNRSEMEELKNKLKSEGIEYKTNGAYKEFATIDETFYNELSNRVYNIEIDFKK